MTSAINQLIDILADNDYRAFYKDIPDYVDDRDMIVAELQSILDDDGHLPDSLRYFALNGNTDVKELKLYLQKSFNRFKTDFLAGKHGDNQILVTELTHQLAEIKKGIEQSIYESTQIKDKILIEMLEAKAFICDEATRFILSHKDKTIETPQSKEPLTPRSYKWLKSDALLLEFYHILVSNGLIANDTAVEDFKAIFSNIPISDIKKPIRWERGAKLFAYFFHQLITRKYIPQKPSWVNLQYCFTYNRADVGKYVPIDGGVKSHVTVISKEGVPKGAELVDKLFS